MNQIKFHKRTIMCIVVGIGVIIIPLLYSFFYLGAFWDPYSKLETLPVAVVNNDKGAVINKTQRNLGKEFCDELQDDGSLNFVFTDQNTAINGTKKDKYYATITIPEDFSLSIASASDVDKKTAEIQFVSNEKRNYLASQILQKAIVVMEESIRGKVDKEIVAQLSDKLKKAPDNLNDLVDGLDKLSNGSSDLVDGTNKLKDGSFELKDGIQTLYNGTITLKDGTTKFKDGTTKLKKGTENLKSGAGSLKDGTNKLKTGSSTLKEGTSQFEKKLNEYQGGVSQVASGSTDLYKGLNELDNGLAKLQTGAASLDSSTTNIDQLRTNAALLASSSNEFNKGFISYTEGVSTLINSVNSTTTFLTNYIKANPSLLSDATLKAFFASLSDPKNEQNIQTLLTSTEKLKAASNQISTGISLLSNSTSSIPQLRDGIVALRQGLDCAKIGSTKVVEGSKQLKTGMETLNDATVKLTMASKQLANGSSELNDGTAKIDNGASKLYLGIADVDKGATTLKKGASSLDNGATDLKNGASDLNNGAGDLKKGVTDLNSGANKLSDGIKEADTSVSESITDANDKLKTLNGLDQFANAPVTVKKESFDAVPNYGTAFAPYFLSLSLWVGGLIIFVGIYLDSDGKFKLLSRTSDKKILRSFAYLVLGFIQAIVLCVVLICWLGLKVQHVGLFYLSCCLISVVFISIIQFLMVFFKDVGKFLSLALLILQLTSCGGTFPMETVPRFFNVLYPYMPMTYSVGILKETISNPNKVDFTSFYILLGILIVMMGLTVMFTVVRKNRNCVTKKVILTGEI